MIYLQLKNVNYSKRDHFLSEPTKWIVRRLFSLLKLKKEDHTISNVLQVKMISTNALSIYILPQEHTEICEQDLCSIQYAMHSDEPAGSKLKLVRTDSPNPAVLTKTEENT